MTQPTLTIKDANGSNQTVYTHNPNGPAFSADSQSVVLATDHQPINVLSKAGLGGMSLVPSGSTNGVALGTLPPGAVGVRFYLGNNDTATFTVSNTVPVSTPVTFTLSGSVTGPNWDENLSNGQMIYITAITGTPKFRWI